MPTMPNVVGLEIADALTSMTKAGARAALGYFQTDPVTIRWAVGGKPGFVTAQTPASGATVAVNAPTTLTAGVFPTSVANFGGIGS